MAKITDVVAWWGAILATIVFAWDIYKWKSAGAKFRLSVQSDMESINIPEYDGRALILANVTNYGDTPTTITHMGFLFYSNLWALLRNKADQTFLVGAPSTAQPVPFELKPGCVWSGIAFQDDKVGEFAGNGYLFCVIYHSHQEKPLKKRITINAPA